MAVKFSQFLSEALGSPSFLVGYNSTTNQNTKVSYAQLVAAFTPGSGTTNYVSKWTSSSALGNSQLDDASNTLTYTASAGNARFVIKSPSGYYYPTLQITSNNSESIEIYNYQRRLYTSALNGHWFGNGSGTQMLLTGNGRLLLGTTVESTYELDVVGDIRSTLDANINGLTVGKGGGSVLTNTAVGFEALLNNSTGLYTIAIGYQAARSMTSGTSVMIGYEAGRSVSTGDAQILIGYRAGKGITTGANNIILGNGAGEYMSGTANQNILIGNYVGQGALSSSQNVLIGHNTGNLLESGGSNVFIGRNTGGGITTGANNTIIGANVTGLSSSLSNTIILADGQGNQRLYINSSGNVGIKTTNPTYDLYVQGQTLSTEGLSAGTDSYTGGYGLVFRAASGSQSQIYTLFGGVVGPQTIYNSGGVVHRSPLIRIANNSGTEYARFDATTSSLLIGTTTSAGYKLDVNGTARVQGNLTTTATLYAGASNISAEGLYSYTGTSRIGLTLRNDNNNTQSVIRFNSLIASSYASVSFGMYGIGGDKSLAIDMGTGGLSGTLSYVFAADGTFKSNTAGLFGSNGSINASAVLEATSTTKGFLPPRMTGIQAEAIATPAAGLLIYSTDGSGTTITSAGWWGYDGTNWIKIG